MFRRWFGKRATPMEPSHGPNVVCTAGQQIHLSEDIILSIIRVTPHGVAMTIAAPPHIRLAVLAVDPPGDA
jgi:hypothetical protein